MPPSGAVSCSGCHAPAGAMPAIAGRPADEIVAAMIAFRDGSRPATVMHQIAKGYTDAQLDTLATYFAAQPR